MSTLCVRTRCASPIIPTRKSVDAISVFIHSVAVPYARKNSKWSGLVDHSIVFGQVIRVRFLSFLSDLVSKEETQVYVQTLPYCTCEIQTSRLQLWASRPRRRKFTTQPSSGLCIALE